MNVCGVWLLATETLGAFLLCSCAPQVSLRAGVPAAGVQYIVTDRVDVPGTRTIAVYRYSFFGPYVRRDLVSDGGNSTDHSEIVDCSRRKEALILANGRVVRNLAMPVPRAAALRTRQVNGLNLKHARPLGHRLVAGVPADGYRLRAGDGTIEVWFAVGIRRPTLNVLCESTMPQVPPNARAHGRLVLVLDQRSPSGSVTKRVSGIKPLSSKDMDLFAPVLR